MNALIGILLLFQAPSCSTPQDGEFWPFGGYTWSRPFVDSAGTKMEVRCHWDSTGGLAYPGNRLTRVECVKFHTDSRWVWNEEKVKCPADVKEGYRDGD